MTPVHIQDRHPWAEMRLALNSFVDKIERLLALENLTHKTVSKQRTRVATVHIRKFFGINVFFDRFVCPSDIRSMHAA